MLRSRFATPSRTLVGASALWMILLGSPIIAQGPGRPAAPEPGTLVIRNIMWESVRIEVRIGPSANCEMNPLVGVRSLRKGRAWAVKSERGVCWRRERAPGSSARNAWTDWSRRVVPSRATVRITA